MSALDDFKKLKQASPQMSFPWGNTVKGQAASAVRSIPGAFASGVGMATAGAAVAGTGIAIQKIYDAITKKRDFQAMLENNADLQEAYDRNPKQFNLMFSTLRSMNPAFSKDPLVAGTYMRRMAESPSHAGAIAVEALGHRDSASSSASDAFLRGGLEGIKRG